MATGAQAVNDTAGRCCCPRQSSRCGRFDRVHGGPDGGAEVRIGAASGGLRITPGLVGQMVSTVNPSLAAASARRPSKQTKRRLRG
jgi:hypothetical protein